MMFIRVHVIGKVMQRRSPLGQQKQLSSGSVILSRAGQTETTTRLGCESDFETIETMTLISRLPAF